MKPIIELKKIKKVYKTGEEKTVAVCDIDFAVKRKEFVAIMGASGSGKSTLMNIIGLLDQPTSGKYLLDGKDVSRLKNNQLAKIRNQKIGFVFQQFNLLPRTSVLDNVLLPTIYGDISNAKQKAKDLLKLVGIADKIKSQSNRLSGGQVQRVAIARALMMNPSIILADEPTGNLDTKTSGEIMKLLKKINQNSATIILITHELDIAKYAQRIVRLKDGKII